MKRVKVGVLALQGDFAKHIARLHSLGIDTKEVKKAQDLEECDGLIIPGGESTVMLRQLDFIHMKDNLCEFAKHKPLFGTCAGLILMSTHIQNSSMRPLGLIDVTVERNAFGRQVESFQVPIQLQLFPQHFKWFEAYFIRAPSIQNIGSEVEVLASYQDNPILVRQGHHLAASFHPELTDDPVVHQFFLEIITLVKKKRNF